MAALAHHLSVIARTWLNANSRALTPDGEIELQGLLDIAELRATARPAFSAGNVPLGTADLSEAEANLIKILSRAAALAGGTPIDAIHIQTARLFFCPLFPFC